MMKKHINKHEIELQQNSDAFFKRLKVRSRLAFLYLSFAFHRSFHLIFSRPTKSFALVNNQDKAGTWRASFIDHLHYKAKARAFSLSSFLVIILSLAVVYSTLSLTLPNNGQIQPAYAATVQKAVTNINDGGPGSLRSAINFLNNNVNVGDTGVLHLDTDGAIALATPLPALNKKIQIVNDRAAVTVAIDGSALGVGDACLHARADEARIQSVILVNCPIGVNVSNNASNVEIGTAGEANRIYMHGTMDFGVKLSDGTSGATVTNTLIGIKPGGGAVNTIKLGVRVHELSTGNLIHNVTIGDVETGIVLQGDANEVYNTFIGTNVEDDVLPITQRAIDISGDSNIIGGDGASKAKVIIKNVTGVGMESIRINNSADGNKIRKLDIDDSDAGILLHTATNTEVGSASLLVGPTVRASTRFGISLDQANDTVIIFGNIRNSGTNGVTVQNSSNVGVVNTTVGESTQAGIRYQQSSGQITGVSVINSLEEGILAMQSEMVIGDDAAAQNGIATNGKAGIVLQAVTGMSQIENNAVTDNAWNGIDMFGNALTVTVNNNTVTGNGTAVGDNPKEGIIVRESNNGVMSDNVVSGNNRHGISILDCTSWSVSGNVVTGNIGAGIRMESDSASNQVTGNYIGVNKAGVVAGNANGVVIVSGSTGNTIGGADPADANIIGGNNSGGVVIGATAALSNLVSGNYIGALADGTPKANGLDGVIVAADSQTVTNNTIVNNGGSGIFLDASNDVTVYDNVITNNSIQGIRASGGSGHAIRGNTISSNTLNGFAATDNASSITIGGTLVQGNTISNNGQNGVLINQGSEYISVVHNTITGHTGGVAIRLMSDANEAVLPPIIINVNESIIAGSGGISGGKVHVYKNGVPYGSATADSNGNWQITSFYGAGLQGQKAISAGDVFTATNTNGNGSTSGWAKFAGAEQLSLVATVVPTSAGVAAAHTFDMTVANRPIGPGETPKIFFVDSENIVQSFDFSSATINAEGSALPVGTTISASPDGKAVILNIPVNWAPDTYTLKLDDVINVDTAGAYTAVFTMLSREAFTNNFGGDTVSITASNETLLICPASKTVDQGGFYDLEAYYTDQADTSPISCGIDNTCSGDSCTNVSQSATWESDDTGVATVANTGDNRGRVTGVTEGDADITVSYEGLTAGADITVGGEETVDDLIVCPATKTIDEAQTYDLEAYYTDNTTTGPIACGTGSDCIGDGCINVSQSATWASDSSAIATVLNTGDYKGRITGVDVGSTDVTATYASLSDDTTVTVEEGPPVPALPPVPTPYFDYTYVNGERVFSKNDVVYLAPATDPVIKITNANNAHDVRITLKDTLNNVVQQGDWKKVNNAKVEQKLGQAEAQTDYNAYAKARLSAQKDATSPQKKITSLKKTRSAPTVNMLEEDNTVLMRTTNIEFGINLQDGETGKVEWQDALTGELVVSCTAAAAEGGGVSTCSLPFAPPIGEYYVKQYTLRNGTPSASKQTYAVLTPTPPTTVINTDVRNENYYKRDVIASDIKVVGIAPADTEVEIILDGNSLGNATFKTEVGWEMEVDLAGKARAQTHMILIKKRRNGNIVQEPQKVPFFFSNLPVELNIISEQEYYIGEDASITIQGGASDDLFIKNSSGQLFLHDIFPTNGSLQVTLDTSQAGLFTLTAYGERGRTGLRTTEKTISYEVKAVTSIVDDTSDGLAGRADDAADDTTADDTTDDTAADDTTADDTTADDTTDDTTTDDTTVDDTTVDDTTVDDTTDDTTADDTTADDTTDDTTADDTTAADTAADDILKSEGPLGSSLKKEYDLIDDDDVPEQYSTPATDSDEIEEIKKKLEDDIDDVKKIEVLTAVDEETGKATRITRRADGQYEVQRRVLVGLPSMQFLKSYFVRDDMDYVELSGATEPYAKVAVSVFSDPLVQIERASDTGEWTMKVPVKLLDAGQHTAYLQTESRGVTSEQAEIARFVVVEEQKLSNTTWIFIINIAVAIFVLLTVFGLQISKRGSLSAGKKKDKQDKQPEVSTTAPKESSVPVAEAPPSTTGSESEPTETASTMPPDIPETPTANALPSAETVLEVESNQKSNDDDHSNHHSALGV